jgi:DNA polymerase-3 subunit beta
VVLLQSERFGPILREATDDSLVIETDGNNILVHGIRSDFELPAANPDEFPSSLLQQQEPICRIDARLLAEFVRRTVFATDTENSRYALGGVLWEIDGNQLNAVGTDGRRLARMQGAIEVLRPQAISTEQMTIVPARVMNLIERLCVDCEDLVDVSWKENDILVTTRMACMSARLVEGRFPRWRDVVQQSTPQLSLELPVGPLLTAVRQAAILTDKESRALDFRFVEGKLELAGWAAELGSSRIEIPVAYHGEEFGLALDNRFLSEFLRVLDLQKTITFTSTGPDAAAHFHTDDGYLYVVMPMERRKPKKRAVAETTLTSYS